jgi:hypothetical protein
MLAKIAVSKPVNSNLYACSGGAVFEPIDPISVDLSDPKAHAEMQSIGYEWSTAASQWRPTFDMSGGTKYAPAAFVTSARWKGWASRRRRQHVAVSDHNPRAVRLFAKNR